MRALVLLLSSAVVAVAALATEGVDAGGGFSVAGADIGSGRAALIAGEGVESGGGRQLAENVGNGAKSRTALA